MSKQAVTPAGQPAEKVMKRGLNETRFGKKTRDGSGHKTAGHDTAPPRLDVNFIANGALLTAGTDTYILNPLGINAKKLLCGQPSIVYQIDRTGLEYSYEKSACCGKPHYSINRRENMVALGISDPPVKLGNTVNMKVTGCNVGPYYGIMDANPDKEQNKGLMFSLHDDARLKCLKPLSALCNGYCEGYVNCNNLIRGRLTRNVHQPIFDGGKGSARQQIGILTHSWVIAPISCCQAMPYRFLHMRIEITNEEFRKTATDDDMIRLSGFLMTTNGGEMKFVDNFLGSAAQNPGKLAYTWSAGSGYDYGLNQWTTYSDIKDSFANGMINSGNLLDKILSFAKAGVAKGKALMGDAKAAMGDAKDMVSGMLGK